MNAPPFYVDLTRPGLSTSQPLGALADALLAGRCDRVLVSFGANARDGQVPWAVSRWLARNDRLVRTRAVAFAVVVPSLWLRWQWKLYLLLSRPVVRSAIHGTEEKARRWLDQVAFT